VKLTPILKMVLGAALLDHICQLIETTRQPGQ
jgi:hypothetical protein